MLEEPASARCMEFKQRTLKEIADMICGNFKAEESFFRYRSSNYLTEFFQDCGTDYQHDGSTRSSWVADVVRHILAEPSPGANVPPASFARVIRTLMDSGDAVNEGPERPGALKLLNTALAREGFEAFYGPASEDELISDVLLPLFRQLGFHRITAAGHRDKALEYGKDIWMKYTLPTQHILYFGIQVKKGKLDAAGARQAFNANVAEILNQVTMMLGHEIFDPEIGKRVLVDHAFIVAAGEITKAARNWLGSKLDISKRSQVMFMDRDDILNLFVVTNLPLPSQALPKHQPLEAEPPS